MLGVGSDFSELMLAAARERFGHEERIKLVKHDLGEPLPALGRFDACRVVNGHPPSPRPMIPERRAPGLGVAPAARGCGPWTPRQAISLTSVEAVQAARSDDGCDSADGVRLTEYWVGSLREKVRLDRVRIGF